MNSIRENNFSILSFWFLGIPIKFIFSCLILRLFKINNKNSIVKGNPIHVIAYIYITFLIITYITFVSFYGIYNGILFSLEENRYFGTSVYVAQLIINPMIAIQCWSMICFFIPDFYDIKVLIHHLLAILISCLSLKPLPQLHYYSLVFYACEITNIPLILLDFFKYFPNLKLKYKNIQDYLKISFFISYILMRLLWWNFFTYKFWKDSFYVFDLGLITNKIVFFITLMCSAVLTFLQFLWGFKIFKIFITGLLRDETKKIK